MTPKQASKKARGIPLYEVEVYDIEDKNRYCYTSHETTEMWDDGAEAAKAAYKVARDLAWLRQCDKMRHPDSKDDSVRLVCILCGRRFSKKTGNIYGTPVILYAISDHTKEVTDTKVMDKKFKDLQIDDYTEQPVLTKDNFYQWPDEDE